MPQVIGVYSHVHPEDCAVLKQFVGQVKEGKATSLSKEVRINRGNGKYSWTSINVMVRDYRPQDGVIEMLCINYDITPLKETEQNSAQFYRWFFQSAGRNRRQGRTPGIYQNSRNK